MTADRRVYDSRHLQADCQEPGISSGTLCSVMEYGLPFWSMGFTFLRTYWRLGGHLNLFRLIVFHTSFARWLCVCGSARHAVGRSVARLVYIRDTVIKSAGWMAICTSMLYCDRCSEFMLLPRAVLDQNIWDPSPSSPLSFPFPHPSPPISFFLPALPLPPLRSRPP